MGGFEFVGEQHNDVFTLTPSAVAILVALGIAPDISSEEINDKSKAEFFTKLLACFQALWMVMQVLTRKGVGLPITLLEYNAMMHIVCAFMTYLVWLRKPKDIYIPTPIKEGPTMGLTWQIRHLLAVKSIYNISQEPLPPLVYSQH